jgi:hypothetical protein
MRVEGEGGESKDEGGRGSRGGRGEKGEGWRVKGEGESTPVRA